MKTPKNNKKVRVLLSIAALLLTAVQLLRIGIGPKNVVHAATQLYTIYDEGLAAGWHNWSWNSQVNMEDGQAFEGTKAVSFTASAWGALYVASDLVVDSAGYEHLKLAIKASRPNVKLNLLVYDQNGVLAGKTLDLGRYGQLNTSWNVITIPVRDLPAAQLKGIALQENAGVDSGPVWVDSVQFVPSATAAAAASGSNNSVYADGLTEGWVNWSWGSGIDLGWNVAFKGNKAIAFSATSPWAGLYLHNDRPVDTTSLTSLNLAIRGTSPNQEYGVALYGDTNQQLGGFVSLAAYGGVLGDGWREYSIPLADLNGANKRIAGVALQEMTGRGQQTILVDEIAFGASTVLQPTAVPSPTPTPVMTTPSPTPAPVVPSAVSAGAGMVFTPVVPSDKGTYTTSAGKIYKSGKEIRLKGVNWFGFETGTHALHGLWARNWKEMLAQIKSTGFNSLRVPFCPETLRNSSVSGVEYSINPDLSGLNSLALLDKMMEEFNREQVYVLLDHHSPNCNTITQLWYTDYYSEKQWIEDLKFVAGRYKHLEYFMGVDLKNEPHGQATWGSGNANTDWNTAAQKAGKAVLSANPNVLVFVQGVQDNPSCTGNIGHWMGGNMEPVRCTPISEADIPSNKLVFSPHVYGPDVYYQGYFGAANFPANMRGIWDAHFGFLVDSGKTVVPGEWGGRMNTGGGNWQDMTLQKTLAGYFKDKRICNSYYWSWNPNSTDTGGILKDDWTTVWSEKVSVVRSYLDSCN